MKRMALIMTCVLALGGCELVRSVVADDPEPDGIELVDREGNTLAVVPELPGGAGVGHQSPSKPVVVAQGFLQTALGVLTGNPIAAGGGLLTALGGLGLFGRSRKRRRVRIEDEVRRVETILKVIPPKYRDMVLGQFREINHNRGEQKLVQAARGKGPPKRDLLRGVDRVLLKPFGWLVPSKVRPDSVTVDFTREIPLRFDKVKVIDMPITPEDRVPAKPKKAKRKPPKKKGSK